MQTGALITILVLQAALSAQPSRPAPVFIDAQGNVYTTRSSDSAAIVTPGAPQTQLGGGRLAERYLSREYRSPRFVPISEQRDFRNRPK